MKIHYPQMELGRPTHFGSGNWTLSGLTAITVIVGKNGSGKSILLRSMRDKYGSDAQYITPERSGEIVYESGIVQRLSRQDPKQAQESRQNNSNPQFRQESITRIQVLLTQMGISAAFSKTIKLRAGEVEELISPLLPSFEFGISRDEPFYQLNRISKSPLNERDKTVRTVNKLSSGEAEALTLALDILTQCGIWEVREQEKQLLLIDEPDTHLHPDLQQQVACFLVNLAKRFNVQMIIATHSTTMLSALGYHGKDNVSVIYLDPSKSVLEAKICGKYQRELATYLGGHLLMGALFGAPLLLVEGDDDYEVWNRVPRTIRNKTLFSVLPCNGDEIFHYQETLERILSSLCDRTSAPIGFVLIDGDKKIPPGIKQEFVQFLRMEAREIENLYLSNEVLASFNLKWDEAKEKLKHAATDHKDGLKRLANCDSWDRLNEDIKDLIYDISQVLDPKRLNWTTRIGKVLAKGRPEGELAEFLGNDLVNAVWGDEHKDNDTIKEQANTADSPA